MRLTGVDATTGQTITMLFNVGTTISLGDSATTFHAAGTVFDGVSLSSLKIESIAGWQGSYIFNGSVVVDNVVLGSGSAPLTHGDVSFTDLTTAINNIAIVDDQNHAVSAATLTSHGAVRIGDLDGYMRTQPTEQFDVLASDENAASVASVDAESFQRLHRLLSQFYRVLVVDTGNNMRASNWRAAVDSADQLVVVTTVREDTAQSAAWALDALREDGAIRAERRQGGKGGARWREEHLDVIGKRRRGEAAQVARQRDAHERGREGGDARDAQQPQLHWMTHTDDFEV